MYHSKQKRLSILLTIFSFMCVLSLPGLSRAAEVTLAWDNPGDAMVAGYKIYCGKSGTDFKSVPIKTITSATQTSCPVSGLEEGQIYGFAATSIDAAGNESVFSDEFYYNVPVIIVDTDGDGVTDKDEINTYGTDPNNIDSDSDGIDDGQEIAYWVGDWQSDFDGDGLINLLDSDSDNDGVNDGTELSQGGNPGDPSDNAHPTDPLSEIIIDNGDAGTSSVGNWQSSGGASYYGNQSVYSTEAGATYTFETSVNGTYDVAVWWTYYDNRCSDLPVEIYDGAQLIDTVYINQLENAGAWNSLGVYKFSGTARIVLLSEGSCTTNVDAVKFVYQESYQEPVNEIILDNGEAGTSSMGTWQLSGGASYYGNQSVYSSEAGATYTFETSVNGTYDVALWWTYYDNRCSDLPVEIYDGARLLDTVYVNQLENAGQWMSLGKYSFNGTVRVALLSGGGCTTNADAVKFAYAKNEVSELDIDDDADGYTENEGDPNDNDATIYPGAIEICGDGIDQDCNGSDLICPEDMDNDGDGYTENEGDCNDSDASIHPGAIEECGDGIDQDCDGSDLECLPDPADIDDDGDGYTENEGDYNDTDATVYPGAIEICGDGIDQDCDGVDLECAPDPDTEIVIDNGEVGTSSIGNWQSSGGASYYGNQSVYSTEAGATYTFETSVIGNYDVGLWWTYYDNRCSDLPVEIYDGAQLLDTVYVNQLENAGAWNSLGVYKFSGTARIVLISGGNCTTNADAVKFVYQESYQEPVNEIILDNGENGTSSIGKWRTSGGAPYYGNQSVYSSKAGDTYTFETSVSGTYDVALWWTYFANRCSSLPVGIYDGAQLLDTVYVNQLENGGEWNSLGAYKFTGTARIVLLSSGDGTANADAVKLTGPY